MTGWCSLLAYSATQYIGEQYLSCVGSAWSGSCMPSPLSCRLGATARWSGVALRCSPLSEPRASHSSAAQLSWPPLGRSPQYSGRWLLLRPGWRDCYRYCGVEVDMIMILCIISSWCLRWLEEI